MSATVTPRPNAAILIRPRSAGVTSMVSRAVKPPAPPSRGGVSAALIQRSGSAGRDAKPLRVGRTVLARETAETLADHDPPVLPAAIGQRVAFAVAAQSGRLVAELDDDTPAAREISALADEIDRLRIGRTAR